MEKIVMANSPWDAEIAGKKARELAASLEKQSFSDIRNLDDFFAFVKSKEADFEKGIVSGLGIEVVRLAFDILIRKGKIKIKKS
jgi:hypothetical protein